jgi:hypothetical protein
VGRRTEAQRVLDEMHELSKQRYVGAYYVAMIYAGLNDFDHTFEWLERAYQDNGGWFASMWILG